MTDFSYQLYCSRNFPPLEATLAMVSGLGYAQVEGYGALYRDAATVAELKRLLGATGLAMPTAHVGLDQIENDPAGVVAMARDLGIEAVMCPYLDAADRPTDAAGWVSFGQRLQAASAPFTAAGIAFGWHNHDFEFAALPDGSVPLDRLFEGGPDVRWEADLGWVARAGADVGAWLEKEADRIIAVHLKDIATEGEATDEDGWADLGHGVLDYRAIFAAIQRTGARYYVMEHDNPSDDRRFARRSIETARTW